MSSIQAQLSSAVASIVGKSAQRAVESLFTPGGTHAGKGDFAGNEDFEVVAFLVVLSESSNSLSPGGGEGRGERAKE